jgi:hypothetical protein
LFAALAAGPVKSSHLAADATPAYLRLLAMGERIVEVCTICHRELADDDHKVSEHGDGWAHDECIANDDRAVRDESSRLRNDDPAKRIPG